MPTFQEYGRGGGPKKCPAQALNVPEFLELGAAIPRKFQNHKNLGPPSQENGMIIGARGMRTQKCPIGPKKVSGFFEFWVAGQENVPELGPSSQESARITGIWGSRALYVPNPGPKKCPDLLNLGRGFAIFGCFSDLVASNA